jgi:hypothetical protein
MPVRSKQLRRWIEALPMANVEAALRSLGERMDETNRYPMAPAERSEMLEALRQPVDLLLREQEAKHARSMPLRGEDRRLATLGQRLRVALVVSYKILVRDLHLSWLSGHLLHRKLRVHALHRQIHYLGRILLADCQLYLPPTSHVWLELHQAYHYAEAAGIQSKPVPNEDPEMVAESTISDQYKLWLLLALAGPYRLQQGQVNLIYRLLQTWAPRCRLRPAGKHPPAAGEFAIDRSADRPPVSAGQLDGGSFNGWYLEVAPLAEAAQEYLDQLPDSPGPGAPRPFADPASKLPELLPRLLWSWGVQPTRASPREAPGGRIAVLCGLEAIHRVFAHRSAVEQALGGKDRRQGKQVAPAGEVENIRLQGFGRNHPVWASARPRDAEHQVHYCQIHDRSQGGYRLMVSEAAAGCLRVGELLALNEAADADSEPDWHLASVRWVRRGHDGTLEFGTQLFAGVVEAVGLERRRQGAARPERWVGLLLGAGSYHDETLITPAFYAEAESSFILVQKQRKQSIELVHAVEITPCFAQFRFAPLY